MNDLVSVMGVVKVLRYNTCKDLEVTLDLNKFAVTKVQSEGTFFRIRTTDLAAVEEELT